MTRAIVWSLAIWMILVAALLAGRHGDPTPRPEVAAKAVDPDLARCRAAGEAGSRDPACQAVWRATRARFLGKASS